MEKRFIYADNAATTAVSEEVLNAMLPHFRTAYGNASSIYELGRNAQHDVEDARAKVAAAIGADPNEIYFTSCGSESDNWAIKSTAERLAKKAKSTSSLLFLNITPYFIPRNISKKRDLK